MKNKVASGSAIKIAATFLIWKDFMGMRKPSPTQTRSARHARNAERIEFHSMSAYSFEKLPKLVQIKYGVISELEVFSSLGFTIKQSVLSRPDQASQ